MREDLTPIAPRAVAPEPGSAAWREARRAQLSKLRDLARRASHDADIAIRAASRIAAALAEAESAGLVHVSPRYREGAALSWLLKVWLSGTGTQAELEAACDRAREDWMGPTFARRCIERLARAGWIVPGRRDSWTANRSAAAYRAIVRAACAPTLAASRLPETGGGVRLEEWERA